MYPYNFVPKRSPCWPYTYVNPYYRQVINHPPYYYYRPLPEVNPDLFVKSSKQMQLLVRDADKVISKMANSTDFSKRVMSLAQESKNNEVKELVKTTGVTNIPDIDFNPDGIFFDFSASIGGTECCHLIIKLRWM